jgi:beta-N-acetylhexosaminidase
MGSRPRLPVVALLVAAAFLAVALAAARTGSSVSDGRATATAGRTAAVPDLTTTARRAAAVQKLTVDQLAGQRIIYAYAGLWPPAALLAAIRAGEAGGVIFFGSNISSLGQIRGVIAQLQRASLASPLHTRLLMLTDQEGGEVRRLPGAPALSEKQIGQSRGAASVAGAAGTGAGHALAGVGMNVNLAPVLDVYRRPGNFIDEFQRSYSSTPATVATLGAAFIGAQQHLGVAATAKHFPGLGAAGQSQNTDLGPVTLDLSAVTLRSADEAPYRSTIAAGVKLVMTSWAVYPALDPFRPAGLSPTVIQGELRRRLRFRGVTITDGIDAGAVTAYGSLARRSVLAAEAGADLILCAAVNPAANTPAQGITAMHAIAAAIASRGMPTASAQQAAARILALRSHP